MASSVGAGVAVGAGVSFPVSSFLQAVTNNSIKAVIRISKIIPFSSCCFSSFHLCFLPFLTIINMTTTIATTTIIADAIVYISAFLGIHLFICQQEQLLQSVNLKLKRLSGLHRPNP